MIRRFCSQVKASVMTPFYVWLPSAASPLTHIHRPSAFTNSPKVVFPLEPQGSESESVNGPGRDSGLASSRLEPSATLPNRGGAESGPEAMEGMLYRKQEMESHSKKAATRFVMSEFRRILERLLCRHSVTSLASFVSAGPGRTSTVS